jgi:hypothetical protein
MFPFPECFYPELVNEFDKKHSEFWFVPETAAISLLFDFIT